MNTCEKQKIVTIIIASFILGSITTTTITSKTPVSSDYSQASIWSRLFGNVKQSEITEYADVIRLVLDHVENIHELETRIALLETCGGECEKGFPSPDYDSGWHHIANFQHLLLEHNLNTMDYLVYVTKSDDTPIEFHNFGEGGYFYMTPHLEERRSGTMWTASLNSIEVYRYDNDIVCNYVRVLLWKIPT